MNEDLVNVLSTQTFAERMNFSEEIYRLLWDKYGENLPPLFSVTDIANIFEDYVGNERIDAEELGLL